MRGENFDLIIVGASFSGAACALAAAQRGLRVCVLERKTDPGHKLHTTGIIVKEAAEQTLLNQIPTHLVRRVEEVRLYAPQGAGSGRRDRAGREPGRSRPGSL